MNQIQKILEVLSIGRLCHWPKYLSHSTLSRKNNASNQKTPEIAVTRVKDFDLKFRLRWKISNVSGPEKII